MPFVEQGSSRIYYEVAGVGPALVLIHGAGGGGEGWLSDGYVEAFGSNFTTVILDISGFGRSRAPSRFEDISNAGRVQDVEIVLDHLGIEQTSIFGFSMGGRIAVAFAMEHPERVSCLVVGSSNPEPAALNLQVAEGRSFLNRCRRLTPRRAIAAAWRRIDRRARRTPPTQSMLMAQEILDSEEVDAVALSQQFLIDTTRAAERITMPTLFFQGDRDDVFSAQLSRAFTKRLAHGEFFALRGHGHAILERRDLVQPIIEPFLLEHGRD